MTRSIRTFLAVAAAAAAGAVPASAQAADTCRGSAARETAPGEVPPSP